MVLAKLGNKRAPREVLSAARTYYVRTDGSNSNNGLANTSGGAFLTIQKAIDVAATLDTSIYDVTIQIGAGTYNITAPGIIAKQVAGAGKIIIVGDETTPANVIVAISGAVTGNDAVFKSSGVKTVYSLRGFKITATATGTLFGIVASSVSVIEFQNLDFGSFLTGTNSQQIRAEDNAIILGTGNYTISGGAAWHWNAVGGAVIRIQNRTITLTGTPNFTTAFLEAARGSVVFVNSNTFTGSATGVRYTVFDGAVITAGGETYLPGNAAGTRYSAGIYNGFIGGAREILTANRTYYVRTDGNNSNTGLVDNSGGAFLTLQRAWDVVASLDLSIYSATIKVADGTYTAGINMTSTPLGGAGIIIEGNTTTPANCHVNWAGSSFIIAAPLPCGMTIRGFKCTYSATGGSAVRVSATGRVTVSNMELAGGSSSGFTGAYRADDPGAILLISTGQTITGNMSCLAQAIFGGVVQFFGITVTITGTPAFSWVTVAATSMGLVEMPGVTFSGSATGVRYSATTAGGINTGGGGATYIPGNSNGSVTSPGWYI